ncbi:hypothetical protein VVD49_21300 [Uliginosibacterium sp. H3]|uniref:Uncharacterized protein n=1 Tax=Uliginosibacterium silvisoli TaxID=3114758 RepID=A0ABU6K8Y2_9RHOO|nr:hypothetical protein [Uliginosibacterium sp. H3]
MSDTHTALTHEWVTLQNNHEQYERSALLIKLMAILVFAAASLWLHAAAPRSCVFFVILCFVLCALWLQEAIVRTSQARIGERLLRIEACERGEAHGHALQLHSEWLASRKGSIGLLGEYATQALRPTIAFPHALLVIATIALALNP